MCFLQRRTETVVDREAPKVGAERTLSGTTAIHTIEVARIASSQTKAARTARMSSAERREM